MSAHRPERLPVGDVGVGKVFGQLRDPDAGEDVTKKAAWIEGSKYERYDARAEFGKMSCVRTEVFSLSGPWRRASQLVVVSSMVTGGKSLVSIVHVQLNSGGSLGLTPNAEGTGPSAHVTEKTAADLVVGMLLTVAGTGQLYGNLVFAVAHYATEEEHTLSHRAARAGVGLGQKSGVLAVSSKAMRTVGRSAGLPSSL